MFVAVMGVGTLVYTITLLGNIATSARAFKSQAALMAVVATTTFFSSALFVPRFGLWGAVWAVGVGCLTHIGGLIFIVLGLLKRDQSMQAVLSLSPEGA